ncbi:MAG: IS3 family transposase [Pseudonocardiaceae bacterium]
MAERPRPPRQYPAAYKLRILEEYERLDKAAKGALLRREGLYTSLISEWRKQRDKGALQAFQQRRGRPPVDPLQRENARLARENARLREQLERARKVIEVQGGTLRAAGPARERQRDQRQRAAGLIQVAITRLAPIVGAAAACRAVGQPRSSWYRHHRRSPAPPPPPRPAPRPQPRALSAAEQARVLEVLHAERFVDQAPASVWATLLDEGSYLCSISTMYRLLRARGETGDRRRRATHPARVKPELLATKPNQCWSWDITKLAGPAKWTWYYLYVILDIYSRYVVGWMVAAREAATLAERLLAEAIAAQQVEAGQLTVHADRGTSMTAKPVAMLLADLGVTKSHSRPHVSDDNPYSESQFKTLKHHPTFPDRFGCIQDARAFCQRFFGWYNHEHRHSGIALLTPADVHYGRAEQIITARATVLDAAFQQHPERFVGKPPTPPQLPGAVWINKPLDPQESPQQFPA